MGVESEKLLERKLREGVKGCGGLAIKIVAAGFTGLPDRLCLFPGGFAVFAEIKTTKKQPTRRQILVHNQLRKLGFEVLIIDTSDQIEKLLSRYERKKLT